MRRRGRLVFCVYRDERAPCVFQKILDKTLKTCGLEECKPCPPLNSRALCQPVIALRILGVKPLDDSYRETWVRASGDPRAVSVLEQVIKREKRLDHQLLEKTRHSMLLRILLPREKCEKRSWCPFQSLPGGVMLRSMVVTSGYMLLGLLVAKQQALHELSRRGCIVVGDMEPTGVGHLTERQEYILVTAFMEGYYSVPRRVTARDLAAKLGVSCSALAETLRSIEEKIMRAFILEEMPHYLVASILDMKRFGKPGIGENGSGGSRS